MKNPKNGELRGFFQGVDVPQKVAKGHRYLLLVDRKLSQVTASRR